MFVELTLVKQSLFVDRDEDISHQNPYLRGNVDEMSASTPYCQMCSANHFRETREHQSKGRERGGGARTPILHVNQPENLELLIRDMELVELGFQLDIC